jgi:hypothetical protein
MADAFKLQVPIDATYRALLPDLIGRYAELSGGSAADGQVLAGAIAAAIDRLAPKVGPDASLDLAFRPNGAGVQVDLSCGDLRESVSVAMPIGNS